LLLRVSAARGPSSGNIYYLRRPLHSLYTLSSVSIGRSLLLLLICFLG
jgi:hypothetical protein